MVASIRFGDFLVLHHMTRSATAYFMPYILIGGECSGDHSASFRPLNNSGAAS